MKSDLRNLYSAQEAFFAEHGRFAHSGEMTEFFRSSTGVTVNIESAGVNQWRARATHAQLEGSCTFASAAADGPRCDVEYTRPRVRPEVVLFNISVDCWLFALSVARGRRRRQEREEEDRLARSDFSLEAA